MAQVSQSSHVRNGSALALVAAMFVGGFEGLRQNAYPDPASRGYPWTICYGHTSHVSPGEHASLGECKRLLMEDIHETAIALDRCIHVPLSDSRYVAVLSLAYNIGAGATCKSSIVRDLNKGNDTQACNDLLRYNRAVGIVFPGLTRRREAERNLCLENQ